MTPVQNSSNLYRSLPFGEAIGELVAERHMRLVEIATAPAIEPDEAAGEIVQELPTRYLQGRVIETCFVMNVILLDKLAPVLIESDNAPEYLKDILTQAMQPLGANLQYKGVDITECWRNNEVNRLSHQAFQLGSFHSELLGDREIDVEFTYDEQNNSWQIVYVLKEIREYERIGRYLYRRGDANHIYLDPVGSVGDEENANDGYYLPSRL